MKLVLRGWLLAAAVLAVGCASGAVPSGNDGGTQTDAAPGGVDAGPDASPGLGGFWDECEDDGDCESGICYKADEDDPTGHCSLTCDGLCPDGYECKAVMVGLGEALVCIPAEETFCLTCEVNSDCGDSTDMCMEMTGGHFCTIDCTDDPDICPAGFTCQIIGEGDFIIGHQCMPLNGLCCIDGDGDMRGVGGGCLAGDCDDDNEAVYDDAVEVCDGFDNDCVGGVDVDVTDCAVGECRLGALGYFERPAEICTDGDCEEQDAVLCDLYTCDGGGEEGDVCAVACDDELDDKCIPDAHCDASACSSDLHDGDACDEDSDCESAHCDNGFCCDSGECCGVAEDCSAFGTFDPVCDNPAGCQGSRGDVVCTADFRCGTSGDVADDSACDATIQADDCDWYLSITCTGETAQAPPVCPASCAGNDECDLAGFCQTPSMTCVEDLDDGEVCGDPAQCKSGHCQNGFCCNSGDCCQDATDCPASYAGEAVCNVPTACQGERDVAECLGSICGTLEGADDDSACHAGVAATGCGPYKTIMCNGGEDQDPPVCPTTCDNDGDCDLDAFCNEAGHCVDDQPNGGTCEDDGECTSAHCQNGFCCTDGFCCADDGDCESFDQPSQCSDQTTCQGSRIDGVCDGSNECVAQSTPDDSGCAGLQSTDCGLYPEIFCTTSMDQPSNQLTLCDDSCGTDDDCDRSARCQGGFCVPKLGQGGACDEPADCTSPLLCIDGVCCNSSCTGACRACDVDGSGTCLPIADGTDPDLECGTVSCIGTPSYYWGWWGDVCYYKADVTTAEATCGGDNACRSRAEECTAQDNAGTIQINCHNTCQRPRAGSCAGTSAGVCDPYNPGNTTCGVGECARTVATCTGGVPNSCTPGASVPEVCDYKDNDCDGTTDDGLPVDSAGATCGSRYTLNGVGSAMIEGATSTYTTFAVYGQGDEDWFFQRVEEADDFCIPGTSEGTYHYKVTVTPPSGRGYILKTCWQYRDDAYCSPLRGCFETGGGTGTKVVEWTWTGTCGGEDGLDFYIHVRPDPALGSNNWSCFAYTMVSQFWKG